MCDHCEKYFYGKIQKEKIVKNLLVIASFSLIDNC